MSKEIFLTNKHTILSSGGVSYQDLYYSHMNSSASLVECTYSYARYTQSLSSLTFGSSSNIVVPNESFLGETWLHMRLPPLVGNQTLCRGWGYGLIQEIKYIFGNSNSSQITLSGASLFTALCAQTKTEAKRSKLFLLGGDEKLIADGVAPEATILLPFPWSSACSKKDFDTSLLSNNIVITITFKQDPRAIYGGSATPFNALTEATVLFRQGDLSNKSLSLKTEMMRDPSLIYAYPLIHNQGFQSPPFAGQPEGSGLCNVVLNGFINSDLLNISFFIVKQSDLAPSGGNSPSPFNMVDPQNIRLEYNGTPLYVARGKSWKLFNMYGDNPPGDFKNSLIRPGNTGPFNSDPIECQPVYIDFSHERSACMPSHMFNTFRISNQTLNVYFNTPDNSNYILFATYMYNGICECKAGSAYLYFD